MNLPSPSRTIPPFKSGATPKSVSQEVKNSTLTLTNMRLLASKPKTPERSVLNDAKRREESGNENQSRSSSIAVFTKSLWKAVMTISHCQKSALRRSHPLCTRAKRGLLAKSRGSNQVLKTAIWQAPRQAQIIRRSRINPVRFTWLRLLLE